MRAQISDVRAEIAGLEARINEKFREQTIWLAGAIVGALIAGMSVAAGIGAAFG